MFCVNAMEQQKPNQEACKQRHGWQIATTLQRAGKSCSNKEYFKSKWLLAKLQQKLLNLTTTRVGEPFVLADNPEATFLQDPQ